MSHVSATCRKLLARVAAAGGADRFRLRDVCPRDACAFACALDVLLEMGLAERVTEPNCRWHYRLTAAGRAVAGGAAMPARGRGRDARPRKRRGRAA